MNKIKIAKSLAIGILSIAALEAHAATDVSVTALFNEPSISISAGSGASVTSSTETTFYADIFTPFKEETQIGSTDSISSKILDTYTNGNTLSSGEFSPDQVAKTTIVNAGSGGVTTTREWDIEISGEGTLSVDVEYSLIGDILNGIEGDAQGFGAVEMFFEGTDVKDGDNFFITDKDSIGDEEFLTFFNTLSISKPVLDGESVTLVMLASTSADTDISAVPLPASLPLFVSAIAGFVLLRTQRKEA